jgi:hypothetical protein
MATKTSHKCEQCERTLSEREVARYNQEFGEWARKHPDWETRYDARDSYILYCASGVRMDCDKCAIERLQTQKNTLASKTFIERAADGGPEGFWLVAVVILGLLAFCFAR